MKKILVMFTGGTIGSRIHNSTIDVDDSAGYHLIKSFRDEFHYDVELDTIQPINILSENTLPYHWQLIFDEVKKVKGYDGIIITHGSDALPYTSAALSFLMRHTRIPIILTASNYAIGCIKSNGLSNFKSCVDFILNAPLPGVFTVFQNEKGKNMVYLASRIMEADSFRDQFPGFGGECYGEIKDGIFLWKKSKINPSLLTMSEERTKLFEEISFDKQIAAMRVYPGLNYNMIEYKIKPKAILHSLYHSATACTDNVGYSLSEYVRYCKEEGIDSYVISFKNIKSDLYRSSREILEAGGIPLQNISFEAAYTKLCIAYNQQKVKPLDYMKTEVFFEYLPSCS